MIQERQLSELFYKLTDEVDKIGDDIPEQVMRLKEKVQEMIYDKNLL